MNIGKDKIDTHISESLKLKEDDIFILCDDDFIDNVGEEKISSIVKDNITSREAANLLIRESRKDFENINKNNTILVVKIDRITNSSIPISRIEDSSKFDSWGEVKNANEKVKSSNWKILKAIVITTVLMVGISTMVVFFKDYVVHNFRQSENKKLIEVNQNIDAVDKNDENTKNNTKDISKDVLEYVVQKGDTIKSISKGYYGDENKYELIYKTNNINKESEIKVGMVWYLYPKQQLRILIKIIISKRKI